MSLEAEIALQALGLDAAIDGRAMATRSVELRAEKMADQWRDAIRDILAGKRVDQPDVPDRPDVAPVSVQAGLSPPLAEAATVAIAALAPLGGLQVSHTPAGDIALDDSLADRARKDLLWRTVVAPVTMLADASRGALSPSQVRAVAAAWPGTFALWGTLLDAELASAPPERAPSATVRAFVRGMRAQVPAAVPAPPTPPPVEPAAPKAELAESEATQVQKAQAG